MANLHTKEDEEKMGKEYDHALEEARAIVAKWDTSRLGELRIALQFLSQHVGIDKLSGTELVIPDSLWEQAREHFGVEDPTQQLRELLIQFWISHTSSSNQGEPHKLGNPAQDSSP